MTSDQQNNCGSTIMILSVLFAILFLHPVACDSDGLAFRNGYRPAKAAHGGTQLLNYDWQYFYFTNTGAPATPQFLLPANITSAIVSITDLFCAGDTFVFTITSSLLNSTGATVTPNGIASCSNHTVNPDFAFNDPTLRWSSIPLEFQAADDYLFTLYCSYSPFTAGAGAIKLSVPDNK